MTNIIAICGYGPGISKATAIHFGKQGFKIALLARNAEKLKASEQEFAGMGIQAVGFPTDLNDLPAIASTFASIKEKLGPLTVILWNTYTAVFKPVLEHSPAEYELQFKGLPAMMYAIQLASKHMEGNPNGTILITGGGFAFTDNADAQNFVASMNANILAIVSAAKRNAVANLSITLKPKGIRIAEVVVTQVVIGSEFESNAEGAKGTIDPSDVAKLFWKQYSERDAPVSVTL